MTDRSHLAPAIEAILGEPVRACVTKNGTSFAAENGNSFFVSHATDRVSIPGIAACLGIANAATAHCLPDTEDSAAFDGLLDKLRDVE